MYVSLSTGVSLGSVLVNISINCKRQSSPEQKVCTFSHTDSALDNCWLKNLLQVNSVCEQSHYIDEQMDVVVASSADKQYKWITHLATWP